MSNGEWNKTAREAAKREAAEALLARRIDERWKAAKPLSLSADNGGFDE